MKEPLHLSVSQEEFETGPGRIQFRIVVDNQGTEDESLFFRVIGAPESQIDARRIDLQEGEQETF